MTRRPHELGTPVASGVEACAEPTVGPRVFTPYFSARRALEVARKLGSPTATEVLVAAGVQPPFMRSELTKVGVILRRAGYTTRRPREGGRRVRRYVLQLSNAR